MPRRANTGLIAAENAAENLMFKYRQSLVTKACLFTKRGSLVGLVASM